MLTGPRSVGLSDRANHYPRQLSGGQEQRVGIARAIVAHPKVVVADEPTGSLDAETSDQVQILLQRLNRELNITMLMVTHDSNVAGIATKQLILDRGKFLARVEGVGSMIGYVLKTMWRHRTRTLLTVSGAAVAMFVFVSWALFKKGFIG